MSETDSVGETTITTPSDRGAVMARTFEAPRTLVWDAYTKPEHVQRWLLGPEGWTMPICEIDLRPGGEWHFLWRRPDGDELEMRGVYREIIPPERLVNTESWGGEWPETENTVQLFEVNGATTVTTTILYPSKEARDAAIATGMADGAERSYGLLDEYLRTLA